MKRETELFFDHLVREVAFAEQAAQAMRAEKAWGPYLGAQPIGDFVRSKPVPLEASR